MCSIDFHAAFAEHNVAVFNPAQAAASSSFVSCLQNLARQHGQQ